MGTGLFDFIAQGCQSLAATAAPSITAMGIHIVVALATMMLVWFGVQEALASSQGGAGFNIGRFISLFMLLRIDGPVLADAVWISFSIEVEPSAPIRFTRLVVPPSIKPLMEKPSPGMEVS